jgi:hypothetical protein
VRHRDELIVDHGEFHFVRSKSSFRDWLAEAQTAVLDIKRW